MKFKKALAVFLALLMLCFAFPFSAFAALAENVPVIVIAGDGSSIYDAEGNEVFPYSISGDGDSSGIIDSAKNILLPLLEEGLLFNKWDNYYDAVEKEVLDMTAGALLDKNGEATNGSGIKKSKLDENRSTMKQNQKPYFSNTYRYWYDWRLDPWDSAALFHEFITGIMKTTGAAKVAIVSRCFGASFLMAYLARYGSDHIKGIGFDGAVAFGNRIVSEAFCGKITFDGASVERYLADRGVELSSLISASLDLLVQTGTFDVLTDTVYQQLYNKLYKELVRRITTDTVANFPSYWSMVLPEDFQQAENTVFGKEGDPKRTEYAGLISKIERYHENVRLKIPEILQAAKENGVNIGIIAKFGIQTPCLTPSQLKAGDDILTVDTASFGATISENIMTPFGSSYINARKNEGKEKYLSPDGLVDASTCLYPDYTWFTKGIEHSDWTEWENDLLKTVCLSDTQLTVDDNVCGWSRFMVKAGDELLPMSGENCYSGEYEGSKDLRPNPLAKLKALIESVIRWFKEIYALISEKLK